MVNCHKIGLFGGTFNPIHKGHIALAQAAYIQLNLDQIIFIPSGISYQKNQNEIIAATHRYKMVELATKDYEYMSVSDVEILRNGNSYLFETLKYFKQEYGNDELYFILGADCLFDILNWKNSEQILKSCILVTVVRDNISRKTLQKQCDFLTKNYNSTIILLEFDELHISSTDIRNAFNNKNYDDNLLSTDVLNYINDFQLLN